MKPTSVVSSASVLVLGNLLSVALAEDGEHKNDSKNPDTYFALTEHVGVMYAHIAVMTIAWVILLPVAVMLSLAKSRYTLLMQFVFLCVNALGIVLAATYNAQTPDLYPNNAHHKIGWIVTLVVAVEVLVGLVGRVTGVLMTKAGQAKGKDTLLPLATQESGENGDFSGEQRMSHDRGHGHGLELDTESLRGYSDDEESDPMRSPRKGYDDRVDGDEDIPLCATAQKLRLASKAATIVASRVWEPFAIGYQVIDRIILPFGFIALLTGIVTYGGFFEGEVFLNGLAHWIKGGVFFWLGLFTLGRWCGSFAEIGWAWNACPHRGKRWRPSCEFVESALICFYGCTNIFLEHLSGWGGRWTGRDLEHLSITVLFIGGGALGMLVESSSVRELLNTTMREEALEYSYADEEKEQRERPKMYEASLNPVPALVILLLGIMMGSHHQSVMISTMVPKQWGNLLSGASLTRAMTYVIMYLKPPKSILPSRPPTELLTSFGLISGGIIFMASSEDTINGMINLDLDVMFMYTVTMGFVWLLMAWEVVVLALKGWAVRKERATSRFRDEAGCDWLASMKDSDR